MQLVSQLQISVEGLAANTRNLVDSQFGKVAEGVLKNLLQNLDSTGRGATLREVVEMVNRMFEAPEGADDLAGEFVLQRPLDSVIRPLVMKLSTAIEKWVLGRLNQPDERLEGAVRSVDWFAKHFERVILESRNLQQGLQQQLSQVVAEILSNPDAPTKELSAAELFARAVSYYRLKLDFSALRATQLLSDKFQSELKGTRESLVEFGRHLRNLAARSADENFPQTPDQSSNPEDQGGITHLLRAQFTELARSVDESFQADFVNARGGLFEAVMGNHRAIAELLAALKQLCIGNLESLASKLTRQQELGSGEAAHSQGTEGTVSDLVRAAQPELLALGGVGNTLAVLPAGSLSAAEATRHRARLGKDISLLPWESSETITCCEVGDLPLVNIALHVINARRDLQEYAERVHTRNDIPWQALACAPPTVEHSDTFTSTMVME